MIVFGAPQRYVQGPGVLTSAGQEIARVGQRAILLADAFVHQMLGDEIRSSATKAGVTMEAIIFNGEVTQDEISRLQRESPLDKPDVILAVGGGKTIDAGKALANAWGARIITAPTIASNDAPTSHIYVLYDNDHRLLSVEKLRGGNPDLVLVDTSVIVNAPRVQLLAGIGDAISKFFEARQCMGNGGKNIFGGTPPYTAGALATACYDLLRAHSAGALAALQNKKPDIHFERLIEATVLLSGLSFENGGLSIAHSMTRGFSALAQTASAPHGFQVAYGLLVQLLLEDIPDDEFSDIHGFYRSIGLPCSLTELGLAEADTASIQTICELTLDAPHARNFKRTLTSNNIEAAIRKLEALKDQLTSN